jgi:hypothetical protein
MGVRITKNTIAGRLAAASKQIRADIKKAVRIVMEVKRTEMVRRTPKEFGTLRNTVMVQPPEWNGNTISCSVVAGGPSAPYAIVQHENLQYRHTEGQAKYIESVILESRSSIGAEVGALVKF